MMMSEDRRDRKTSALPPFRGGEPYPQTSANRKTICMYSNSLKSFKRYLRKKKKRLLQKEIARKKSIFGNKKKTVFKRACWMRNGAQTVHEGITKYIVDDECKKLNLLLVNRKVFFNKVTNKWYITDFYIPQIKLVIEIDGESHLKQKKYDEERSRFLNKKYLTVVRFQNLEVETMEFRSRIRNVLASFLST